MLAVVEAGSEQDAIALAHGSPSVSVWAGDRAHGERVARTLGAEVAWVNEHGHSIPGASVRVAGHVAARRLASQPTRLRSRALAPLRPGARARVDRPTARLQHGRENERLGVLRAGAVPLARTAVRLAREALGGAFSGAALPRRGGALRGRGGVPAHLRGGRGDDRTPPPPPPRAGGGGGAGGATGRGGGGRARRGADRVRPVPERPGDRQRTRGGDRDPKDPRPGPSGGWGGRSTIPRM